MNFMNFPPEYNDCTFECSDGQFETSKRYWELLSPYIREMMAHELKGSAIPFKKYPLKIFRYLSKILATETLESINISPNDLTDLFYLSEMLNLDNINAKIMDFDLKQGGKMFVSLSLNLRQKYISKHAGLSNLSQPIRLLYVESLALANYKLPKPPYVADVVPFEMQLLEAIIERFGYMYVLAYTIIRFPEYYFRKFYAKTVVHNNINNMFIEQIEYAKVMQSDSDRYKFRFPEFTTIRSDGKVNVNLEFPTLAVVINCQSTDNVYELTLADISLEENDTTAKVIVAQPVPKYRRVIVGCPVDGIWFCNIQELDSKTKERYEASN